MTAQVLPITGLTVGGVSPAVMVCGSPERALKASSYLDDVRTLARQREYHAYQGSFTGVTITICSHGVGAPGAAIAFEELIAAGARRIIRAGTCGGLQPGIKAGDLVVATAAVQNTGYGSQTVPDGYPAVADARLALALLETAVAATAAAANHTLHNGIVVTRDSFYSGVPISALADYKTLSQANVIAVEMECAALFILGSLRRVQTAAILAVDGNVLVGPGESMDSYQPHQDSVAQAVDLEIQIALKTLAATAAMTS